MDKQPRDALFLEKVKESALCISKSLHGNDFEICIEALSMVIAAITEDYIEKYKETSVSEITDYVADTVKYYVESAKNI